MNKIKIPGVPKKLNYLKKPIKVEDTISKSVLKIFQKISGLPLEKKISTQKNSMTFFSPI
jgi:hypothetical protein